MLSTTSASHTILTTLLPSTASGANSNTCTIEADKPSKGQQGTRVTIKGTNLLGQFGGTEIVEVTLANTKAAIVAGNSSSELVVVAQPGFGKGDIVITANSGASASQTGAWEYLVPSVLSTVTPSVGQYGTVVIISGARLFGGGTKLTKVSLAGVSAKILQQKDDEIVVQAQYSNATLAGQVLLVSDTGAFTTKDTAWSFATRGSITKVVPASGQHGTNVVITGTNLRGHGTKIGQYITHDNIAPRVQTSRFEMSFSPSTRKGLGTKAPGRGWVQKHSSNPESKRVTPV